MGKKLMSFILVFVMTLSLAVPAFAAENSSVPDIVEPASAGLAWGPVTVGNVKLYMTNQHTGSVPGFSGSVTHVNFHADNASTGKAILNYHIVKYTSGSSSCLYVYDSVSKKVVINKCFKSWTDSVSAVVESVKSAVKAVLSEADWIATVAIWAVVIVVLADLIIPMDPVPILPFSIEPEISTMSNDLYIEPQAA